MVAFLDVLGFSRMVEEDAKYKNAIFLPKFIKIFSDIGCDDSGDVRMFSDSIVISKPLVAKNFGVLLYDCAVLQKMFLAEGILVRGGISFGKHYSNEKVIYSEALVNSYHLESKKAKYPRVLIDKNILDIFLNHPDATAEMRSGIRASLVRDRDGMSFVDYIGSDNLIVAKDVVSSLFVKQDLSDESIIEKVRWLYDYYCYSVSRHGRDEEMLDDINVGFSPL